LLYAAYKGHELCVRVLIAGNANVAYVDRYGDSALHYAASKGHALTCRVLVEEGASLTAKNKKGQTPLEKAKSAECVAILEAAEAPL